MTVEGERLSGEDVTVDYMVGETETGNPKKAKSEKKAESGDAEGPKYEAQADPRTGLLVLLDVRPDAALEEERLARELINRIQRARKKVLTLSIGRPQLPLCVVG